LTSAREREREREKVFLELCGDGTRKKAIFVCLLFLHELTKREKMRSFGSELQSQSVSLPR